MTTRGYPEGVLALLLGCTPTEHPPTSWPAGGCVSVRAGQQDVWLEVDDGVRLMATLRQPSGCTGAVVMIPGGLQSGLALAESPQADAILDAGVAVVAFDPRGRGESGGEEDANGARSQDDLAAVVRWTASQVDPESVVVFSRSFGAAMASGTLARHQDLMPLGWLDYEGPGWMSEDLRYAQGDGADKIAALADAAESPEDWWAEREPAGFVSEIRVPYWRLQGIPDHALGARLDHAMACVNGATASPEVRFNRFPVTLPATDAQLTGWVIDGGLEPDEDYVTRSLLLMLE